MKSTGGSRFRPEPRSRAKMYWQKSQRFARAARSNAESGEWDPAVANAVNAVINLVDAVCVHYLGARAAGEAHNEAIAVLSQASEADADLRLSLGKHLSALLGVKSLAQYEGRLLEKHDAKRALAHMERSLRAAEELAERHGWDR